MLSAPSPFGFCFAITIGSSRAASTQCSRAKGREIVRTPIQVPQANGIAEGFVRTIRCECLDWLLIVETRLLEHAHTVFIEDYNGCRPHRGLDLVPPNGRSPIEHWTAWHRGAFAIGQWARKGERTLIVNTGRPDPVPGLRSSTKCTEGVPCRTPIAPRPRLARECRPHPA